MLLKWAIFVVGRWMKDVFLDLPANTEKLTGTL
jgi:hypothetical protein